jgi:hypothetical protein
MLKIPETDAEETFGIPDQGNSVGATLLIRWSYISAAQSEKPHATSWLVSARGSRPKLSTCSEDRIAQHHMSPLLSGKFLAAYLRYRFVEYIWMSSPSNFHVHLGRKSWVWFLSSTRRAELRSGKHGVAITCSCLGNICEYIVEDYRQDRANYRLRSE